jgi:phage head maturation protease
MNAQSEPIPILRSFESNNVKYIAGYAAIFDSEDSYGTAMTREAVESSRERLKSFPAVRFMHRVPFGQIDFENEIEFEGKTYRTFVDNHGFHVLCRVYDQCENEFNMVKSGKWGFSYGFQPDAHGGIQTRRLANGHTCPAFVKGIIYEVSVVDTPSHADAAAYAVSRIIHDVTTEEPQHREGLIGMIEAAFKSQSIERPTSESLTRAIDEFQFPNLCDPELCPPDYARHCRANRPENYGKPCIYRTPTNEQLKHSETQQRSVESATKLTPLIPNKPNFFKPKNLNECDEE